MKIKYKLSFFIILFLGIFLFGITTLNQYKFYIVSSNSMTGLIDMKSLVVVQCTNIDDIKKGDIIAFKNNNINIVHLVVDKDNTSLQTASVYPTYTLDQNLVYQDNLIGIVRWQSKELGLIILFIANPMMILILMVSLIYIMLNNKKHKK